MKNNKRIIGYVLAVFSLYLLAGCYKDKTVILNTGTEVTKTVSFSNDIITIFNSGCNISGCHNAGGQAPELTATRAYASLTDGNFLNVTSPEESEIYMWMTGKRNLPMPVGGINKDYNAIVLAWIKQGAQNN
jgi:hypothetical protein